MAYKTVIGLEVHVELETESKIYCGCATAFGAPENSQICPICSGQPGVLPMLNRKVVAYAVRAGLALNCKINRYSRQDRKHYFYPDLPKAFQTSQYDLPLCYEGFLDIQVEGRSKRIGITRIHIEEDAGKLIHASYGTRADYNRCGMPLIEIVTEPDLETAAEVQAFLEALREILQYIKVSQCKMEEGAMRCDVNLSMHLPGTPLGVRTEMKNLNSISGAGAAIEYEEKRQLALLEEGRSIIQETRRWDDERGCSYTMRTKEDADEYFYFPEPDIMPLRLSEPYIQNIQRDLPELPAARRQRYQQELGLSAYDAGILTSSRGISDFFDESLQWQAPAKMAANFIMGDLLRLVSEENLNPEALTISPEAFAQMLRMIEEGELSNSMGSRVLTLMVQTGQAPDEIAKSHGLRQMSDQKALENICRKVIQDNAKIVQDYLGGKGKALGALVGQVMRETKGQANPGMVNEILEGLLEALKD